MNSMNNINYKVLTIIWIALPIFLIIGLLPIPFWYYASIRWVLLFVSGYIATISLTLGFPINFVLMLCIMFLFRPIYPFILEGSIWVTFNISALVLISITIYYLREEYKRKDEVRRQNLYDQINNLTD